MAFEAKEYPLFGIMFHPETANRHVVGLGGTLLEGKVNNEVTDEINFRFSEFIHGQASLNLDSHSFADPGFGYRMEVLNSYAGFTFSPDNYLLSYGLDN